MRFPPLGSSWNVTASAGWPHVDSFVLSDRLDALHDNLGKLRSLRAHSRDAFVQDWHIYGLAERHLALAMECVLDIARHLIASSNLRTPHDGRDTVRVLVEASKLPSDLGDRLQAWIGYRNILTHDYLCVDHGRAYDAIHMHLGDLDEFGLTASAWL